MIKSSRSSCLRLTGYQSCPMLRGSQLDAYIREGAIWLSLILGLDPSTAPDPAFMATLAAGTNQVGDTQVPTQAVPVGEIA